jgi:hypothetical protein
MSLVIDLLSLTYAQVQTTMLRYIDVRDVIALSRTCRALSSIWQRLLATSYKIDQQLRPFFNDAKAFRAVQRQCNAFITEAFARRFITRSGVQGRNHYIHVAKEHAPVLATYLVSEGYE